MICVSELLFKIIFQSISGKLSVLKSTAINYGKNREDSNDRQVSVHCVPTGWQWLLPELLSILNGLTTQQQRNGICFKGPFLRH